MNTLTRRADASEQTDARRPTHMATQTKTKFKEMGIQNKIMNTLLVETNTQVESAGEVEATAQTEPPPVGLDAAVDAFHMPCAAAEAQTEILKFVELCVLVENDTQTTSRTHNRGAQTLLSSTIKTSAADLKAQEVGAASISSLTRAKIVGRRLGVFRVG